MATAQQPAAPTFAAASSRCAPARERPFSGASCTRCWASSPSAPSCWSTCSRTSRPSKARPPTARRSSSSTACRWCACWSGSSSFCPSSITPLRRLHLAARQVEHRLLPLGRQLDVHRPALHRPDRLRSTSAARHPPALHGHQPSRAPHAAFAKVQHELANPWMLAVYVVAMIAICWHFSYGVWLFAAKWGITPGTTPASASATSAPRLGVALAVMGLASIWAFVGGKYPTLPKTRP
jgi:hypothetical protein